MNAYFRQVSNTICLFEQKNAVKFFIPSGLHESVSYADPSHLQVPNQAQNVNKSRQSIVVNKTPAGSINNSINLNYHHSKTIKVIKKNIIIIKIII